MEKASAKPILRKAALLALCYLSFAIFALMLTRQPNAVASIWLANAVACAFLIESPRRQWPGLLLATAISNCAAELLFGDQLYVALYFSLTNIIEISFAAWLVQRSGLAEHFTDSPKALGRVMLSACSVPMLASASLGALGLSMMGVDDYRDLWLVWFASSCTGMVALLPLALLWRQRGVWELLKVYDILTTPAQLLICLAFSLLVLLYLPFPFVYLSVPLVLVALYLSFAHVALFNCCMAILISILISLGYFIAPPFTETWQSLLLYLPILVMLVPALLLAASVEQSRRRERDFQLSEARFRSALEFAGTGFALASRDGRITEANLRLCEMLGYDREELIGRQNTELGHPDDAKISRDKLDTLLSGRTSYYSLDKRFLRRSGESFWAHVTVATVPGQFSAGEIIIQIDDISEMIEAQRKLNQLRIAAEKANRTKSEFLANMSHEIRTPMNGVLGITQLLENTELNATQRQYLDMLRNAGKSLLSVINDILDFSKIEAGHLQLSPVEFELEELVTHTSSMMMVLVGSKDIELLVSIDPQVPAKILADQHRLEQVLINLVGNAMKFTEQGEVELSIRLQQQGTNSSLLFSVRDTGIGISHEHQSRLFQAFEQVDGSMTRQYGGTGLGLAISKRLVNLMDGDIGVKSGPLKGSLFWFSLPLRTVSAPPVFPQILHGKRVLLIDRNLHCRDNITQLLHQFGATVTATQTSTSAEELLKQARHLQTPFQLTLLDLATTPADEQQILQQLAQAAGQLPPTLLLVNAFDREQRADSPAQHLLLKPVTRTSLLRALHEVLESPAAGNTPHIANEKPRESLAGRHVLLVEDNQLNQVVARGILEHLGAQVSIVGDGQQAVDLLAQTPAAFDLVLMDVQRPVMDGFTATRLIRQQLHLTLPVLAMSAGVTSAEREQCTDAGMNDFIAKPVNIDNLLNTILLHLSPDAQNNPASTSTLEPAASTEIFSSTTLDQLCATSTQMHQTLAELVVEVLQRGPAPVQEARQAWQEQRPEDAARIVHTLRGGMGTLGAVSLPELTLQLEQALKQGDALQSERLLSQLEVEFALLLQAFADWLAANPPKPTSGQA